MTHLDSISQLRYFTWFSQDSTLSYSALAPLSQLNSACGNCLTLVNFRVQGSEKDPILK